MAALNLSINVNDENCPFGEPVSITDNDTGRIISCHKTVIDAQKARALMAAGSTPPTVVW